MQPEAIPLRPWSGAELVALGGGAVVTVLVVMGVAASSPLRALAGLAGLSVLAVVVARPVRAAYLFLLLTPLLAGFPRGAFVPSVRPSELLLAVLLGGVVLRFLVDALGDGRRPEALQDLRVTDLDRSILAMAVLSSAIPLAWRAARGYRPLLDDVLYATTLWKYLLIFLLFRMVVVSRDQVIRCVWIMLGVGVVVGGIAIAQSLDAPGVARLLASVQEEPLRAVSNNRGSSTIGTSHGVADVMAFDLALCLAFWRLQVGPRWLTGLGAVLFGLACFASGQVSALLALVVVAVVFGWLTGRLGQSVAIGLPAIVVSGALLWPVVRARLDSATESGLPDSWEARRFNLTNYFWPELLRGGNWVFGVRPAGRVPSYEPWRDWVYIESGHTWLLWTGGVPLFLAFLWFSRTALRGALALVDPAHRRPTPGRRPTRPAPGRRSTGQADDGERLASALGLAVAVAYTVVFVLMVLDVHLTMRGPADALFPLLALVTVPALWSGAGRDPAALLGRPRLPGLVRS